MAADILQRFVSRKLLDEIGSDDDRLTKLRAAATEIAASLGGDCSPVVRYTSVALDPEVSADEPALAVVASVIESHWNTYLSCFADKPIILYRAVLLEALRQAQAQSLNVALAVNLISANLMPHVDIGSEQGVWTDFLQEQIPALEHKSNLEWGSDFDAQTSELKRSRLTIALLKQASAVDRPALRAGLRGSAGGQAPNAQWPHGNAAAWAELFADNAMTAIADAIDKSVRESIVTGDDLTKVLVSAFDNLTKSYQEAMKSSIENIKAGATGLQRRMTLLWWKEAAYSPSSKRSYRDFSPGTATLLMTFDLFDQVPLFCPQSVEFFLKEVVAGQTRGAATTKKSRDLTLSEMIAEIVKADLPERLRKTVTSYDDAGSGRKTLLALLGRQISTGVVNAGVIGAETGVPATARFSYPDLAAWLFREALAIRAVA